MVMVILSTAAVIGATPRSAQHVGHPDPTAIPDTSHGISGDVIGSHAAQTGAPSPTARPSERAPLGAPAMTSARPYAHRAPSRAHRPVVTPTRSPRPVSASTGAGYALHATWYCNPPVSRCTAGHPSSCLCAAISPDLASWTGHLVRVCSRACVTVRVVDCNCQSRHGIDLYAAAFRRLAPLSAGALTVTAEVVG
jgi:hypothetical protein